MLGAMLLVLLLLSLSLLLLGFVAVNEVVVGAWSRRN